MTITSYQIREPPKEEPITLVEPSPPPEPEIKAEPVPEQVYEEQIEEKEPEPEYSNKFSGNIPPYVPIGTTSVNAMFTSEKYLEHIGQNEGGEEIVTQRNGDGEVLLSAKGPDSFKLTEQKETNDNKPKDTLKKQSGKKKRITAAVQAKPSKKEKKPPVKPKTTTSTPLLPELNERPKARMVKSKVILNKKQPVLPPPEPAPAELKSMPPIETKVEPVVINRVCEDVKVKVQEPTNETDKESAGMTQRTQKSDFLDEEQFIPHPEKYNEHLVHTYSLPKALPVYKRVKVSSEAERFFGDKYSKESVLSAVYPKMSGVRPSKMHGFKGHKLPISELYKTKFVLTKVRDDGPFTMTRFSVSNTASDQDPRVEGCGIDKTQYPAGKTQGPCVLQNTFIKERSLCNTDTKEELPVSVPNELADTRNVREKQVETDRKDEELRLPQINGAREETEQLLEKVKKEAANPVQCVSENNKLINMLLSEEVKQGKKGVMSEEVGNSEYGRELLDDDFFSDDRSHLEKIEEEDCM